MWSHLADRRILKAMRDGPEIAGNVRGIDVPE